MIALNIDLAANHSVKIANLEDRLFNNNLQVIYEIDKLIKVIYVLEGDQLIAFLTFKRDGQNIEIYNFGVDPNYRRQKIGSQIVNSLKGYNCSLEVRESNDAAITFYLKQGFKKSFIRKNYYGAENAIVLERGMSMVENAYAKINLVLNVISKQDNGYHQIEFLMNSVDLHDVVKITKSDKDDVIVTNQQSLSGLDNLAYKALQVMRDQFGFKTNYLIEIEKNIPVAAGMAGGSTDAAAVMRIINKLEHLKQSEEQLATLAAKVGSDVSFCIYSRLAIATGLGEKIELVNADWKSKYILVVNPGVPLSTQEVYQNHQISNTQGSIANLLAAETHQQFEQQLFNSLGSTAAKLCPPMEVLRAEIESQTTHPVLVSGSGPTLLVFSEDQDEIKKLYEYFAPKYKHTHIAKMK